MKGATPVEPIRPGDIVGAKTAALPGDVLAVFNILIAKAYSGGSAIVKQEELVLALIERGHTRRDVFDNHWLDVEDIYRDAGWMVEYDKPGYNESYGAYYTFSLEGSGKR